MMEWIIDFFTDKENIGEIALIVIGILIGLLFTAVGRLFKWLSKLVLTGGKKVLTNGKNKLKKMKLNREYMRTIKQVERMEIPVTDKLLFRKSPEENPELEKIFQMMDDGLIEMPPMYKTQKYFKDHPELMKNIIEASKSPVYTPQLTEIKPPIIKK